jgi:hypothetical protein
MTELQICGALRIMEFCFIERTGDFNVCVFCGINYNNNNLLEKVLLSVGRVGHLPSRGQRQLFGNIERLVADVRVMYRAWSWVGSQSNL